MARRMLSLTGRTFGSWRVLGPAGQGPQKHSLWRCRCSCGREGVLIGTMLATGRTARCRWCQLDAARPKAVAARRVAAAGRVPPPDPRAPVVLRLRAAGLTWAEVGRRLGLSRERARQIHAAARPRGGD